MPSYKQEEPKKAGTYFVEPGIYRVEIRNAVEKTSQNGNPMIKLVCKILLKDDVEGPEVWDHLVFTAKASWKIDQFLASIGQAVVPGEEVSVEATDLIGEVGVAEIGEEQGTNNPDQRFNNIQRWVFGEELKAWKAGKPAVKIHKDADGDEIPF
jgi:predicted metal-dependent phosphoesterase TrpH